MALLCAPAFPHRPQSLEELAALPLLLRERGSGTRRSVDRVFEEHSLSPQPFLESVSSTALIEAARAGLGVLILSPSLARRNWRREPFCRWRSPAPGFSASTSAPSTSKRLSPRLWRSCWLCCGRTAKNRQRKRAPGPGLFFIAVSALNHL